ncbi:hypothetical protein BGZ92_000930 [Podila epicladia]|nr:hypothetical protein BGZ92_000930 [Podila epicladia]
MWQKKILVTHIAHHVAIFILPFFDNPLKLNINDLRAPMSVTSMDLPRLIVFHTIGTDPKRDYPAEFGGLEGEFTVKCIPTNENPVERYEIFLSIPNTVDFFLCYDGTEYLAMCDRKGKGFVIYSIMHHGDYIGRMWLNMTSFKELALEHRTYGDDSDEDGVPF